jgi:hypothetical protein
MNAAAVRFIDASARAEAIRAKIAGIEIERGDLVLRSRLAPDQPLNDHLVWLWGMLKHQRRYLKNIQSQGISVVCECEVPRGSVRILPNGAEMLHLLGIELVLEAR